MLRLCQKLKNRFNESQNKNMHFISEILSLHNVENIQLLATIIDLIIVAHISQGHINKLIYQQRTYLIKS